MILVKCDCNCFFTLEDKAPFSDRAMHPYICQNCSKSISLKADEDIRSIKRAMENTGIKVCFIPEETEIKFSFK